MAMKRRSTEPGLGAGGLVEGEPSADKSSLVRDRGAHELLDEIARRSSAPPPSAAVPLSRKTASLESAPPAVRPKAHTTPPESAPPESVRSAPIARTESTPPKGKLISRPPISRVSDPPPASQPPRSERVISKPPSRGGSPNPPKVASSPPKASKQSFRSSRPAIRVDDVGAGASKMVAPRMTPKLVRGANLKNAKIDSRDAFILSLIDGKLDLPGLVDVAGLPSEEVSKILERLEGLGLVKLG